MPIEQNQSMTPEQLYKTKAEVLRGCLTKTCTQKQLVIGSSPTFFLYIKKLFQIVLFWKETKLLRNRNKNGEENLTLQFH